jgi:uncharacterized protein
MKKELNELVQRTEKYVQEFFVADSSGHDWWHIFRVRNMALKIAEKEGGNRFIIEMAALLHDLDDWKITGESSYAKTKHWLEGLSLQPETGSRILQIISQVSFKGAGETTEPGSLEAKIVQDADRLDAIGAIGIARAFAYGGSKGRLIFHPQISPVMHADFESYKKSKGPTINHFYEKLLHIKERLNTQTARQMADRRHRFTEVYLQEFFLEWGDEIKLKCGNH